MYPSTIVSKLLAAAIVLVPLAVGASTAQTAHAAGESCAVSDVDYSVVSNLLIKDTQFGAADGLYPLGAGKVRVRYETAADGSPRTAKLMSYEVDNHLTVKASFALWSTKVVTESHTSVANSCEGAAKGQMSNKNDVVWRTAVDGYHSDGTLSCEGNVCGKFGAPSLGSSPLHETAPITFNPFHFDASGKSFSMDYTRLAHSDSPKQTTYLTLAGHETGRTCVTEPVTCQTASN